MQNGEGLHSKRLRREGEVDFQVLFHDTPLNLVNFLFWFPGVWRSFWFPYSKMNSEEAAAACPQEIKGHMTSQLASQGCGDNRLPPSWEHTGDGYQ